MRFLLLLSFLLSALLADKDGNGNCWQREKIEALHNIKHSAQQIEYGSVIAGKDADNSDYYYFTPKRPSTFTLIFNSNQPLNLEIGTSCKDHSILNEHNEKQFVVLDQEIKETIYIHVTAISEKLSSYEMHVNVSLKGEKAPRYKYNNFSNFGSHFDCQVIDGNVTCKR
jgi:hypothetical protein